MDYEVDNAAVQYLGVGETATETFTVTIDDGKGGTVSQTVTVVVTGQRCADDYCWRCRFRIDGGSGRHSQRRYTGLTLRLLLIYRRGPDRRPAAEPERRR